MNTDTLDLASVPTDALIGELTVRRARIDQALESARVWDTRTSPLIARAAHAWNLTTGALFQKTNKARTVAARTMAMALVRQDNFTHADIAELFGMETSSISCALRRHEDRLAADPDYRRRWDIANPTDQSTNDQPSPQ